MLAPTYLWSGIALQGHCTTSAAPGGSHIRSLSCRKAGIWPRGPFGWPSGSAWGWLPAPHPSPGACVGALWPSPVPSQPQHHVQKRGSGSCEQIRCFGERQGETKGWKGFFSSPGRGGGAGFWQRAALAQLFRMSKQLKVKGW